MTTTNLQLPIEIDKLRSILKKYGVTSASIFGSFARGEARPDSDLDLLVNLKQSSTLFDLVDLQSELELITGHKIDIATRLHPRFEPYITPELIEVL